MKNVFLSLAILLSAQISFAAIQNFDIDCTIYEALVPKKDPNQMLRYGIEDNFRLKLENGTASLEYGYGPGLRRVGKAITWVPVLSDVKATVTSTRWNTVVVIPTEQGPITVNLEQGSRSNANGHFINGIFEFPMGYTLKNKLTITKFDSGFCFNSER